MIEPPRPFFSVLFFSVVLFSSVMLPRRGYAAALAAALLAACASGGSPPHRDLAVAWRDYRSLPEERALAIAGDPRRGRWVAGASGGHALPSEAQAEALVQCRIRRAARRMQAPCLLYAVGDEIVWSGP